MPDRTQAASENRYSRQIRFAPIGAEGQQRLRDGCALIVGTGALGASLAQHMARAGVGTVRVVDRDYVELSNLHRQTLFDEDDARSALPKSVAAAAKLRKMNSAIRVESFVADVNARNAEALLEGVDLVLDGTDNAETRLLLSDACFGRGIPFVYGGVAGSAGMTGMLVPGETACLRCLIGGEAEEAGDRTCDAVGVISSAVETVAALQASEALKWLSGNRSALRRSWLSVDVWDFSVRESALPKPRVSCFRCGIGDETVTVAKNAGAERRAPGIPAAAPETVRSGTDWAEERNGDGEPLASVVLCGRDTVQVTFAAAFPLSGWRRLAEQSGGELIAVNAYLVKWSAPSGETIVVFADGRALVQGTNDGERAIALCRHYLNEWREPACAAE